MIANHSQGLVSRSFSSVCLTSATCVAWDKCTTWLLSLPKRHLWSLESTLSIVLVAILILTLGLELRLRHETLGGHERLTGVLRSRLEVVGVLGALRSLWLEHHRISRRIHLSCLWHGLLHLSRLIWHSRWCKRSRRWLECAS